MESWDLGRSLLQEDHYDSKHGVVLRVSGLGVLGGGQRHQSHGLDCGTAGCSGLVRIPVVSGEDSGHADSGERWRGCSGRRLPPVRGCVCGGAEREDGPLHCRPKRWRDWQPSHGTFGGAAKSSAALSAPGAPRPASQPGILSRIWSQHEA